jgi:hypothetical protein
MRPFRFLLLAILVLATGISARPGEGRALAAPALLPPPPPGFGPNLELGMSSSPGDAANARATAPFAFRSQYLSGGVNTGGGWATWNTNGDFVRYYAQDSLDHGITPVFDYYMLMQSNPGVGGDEGAKNYSNLNNAGTMASYWADLKLFFQKAGAFSGSRIILQFEPDFWGFMNMRAGSSDSAAGLTAKVGSSGTPELAGIADTVPGFAQGALHLRDLYAPNVLVGYHVSAWGGGNDIVLSNPSDSFVDAYATRAANFYRSLNANFDVAFIDPSDRDAAFKQYEYGDGGAGWWDAGDYARHLRFVSGFVNGTGKRMIEWQIPLGNTKMRAQNNTRGHYQDNHIEWVLDDANNRARLIEYANAGVIAMIFGGGAQYVTCACDAMNDGVTNPPAINGNNRTSLNADDDGGYFRERAAAYYAAGALALPGGSPLPSPTPRPSPSPTFPPGPCVASTGPGIPPPASDPAGIPGLHAAWHGQSGYPTLCAGQRSTATATVAFYNSGSVGWVRGRMGEVAYLGTWEPEPGQDRASPLGGDGQMGSPATGWPRHNRIALQPADYVGPGQVAWFQFTIQAPSAPGTYRLYLRPVIEGASWLEDYGVYWLVTVR